MTQKRSKPQRPWPRFQAVISRLPHRRGGYTVQDRWKQLTWFEGPGCTTGWYKSKKDAQDRADVYNQTFARGQLLRTSP
jgi:hypothetical protein